MKRTLPILATAIAVLAGLFMLTAPLHVGYYADWNGILREIRARPGLEVVAGSRNEDLTLEEIWLKIRSARATVGMSLAQDGARRAHHRLDGIWMGTGGWHRVTTPDGNTTVHRMGAHLRFDSDEWKHRGLPRVQTLGDVLDHFDEITHSLITHPPAPTAVHMPGEYLHLDPRVSTWLSGIPHPQPVENSGWLERTAKIFR